MKNKINILCAGGAGISIADKVIRAVANLGEGFADIRVRYMDTSRANIKNITHNEDDFWLVKGKSASKIVISGSGGVRSDNTSDIDVNVKEFMDKHKLLSRVTGEYNIVIFSAGGGSGSVIGPLYVKNLLERGINVLPIVIGDSTSGGTAVNTLGTLATLSNISLTQGKPLSIMYVNNHSYIEHGALGAIETVNEIIFNSLCTLSLFLSGENESLDFRDLEIFIDPSTYKKLDVPVGLCGIGIYSKTVDIPKGTIPTLTRTLSVHGTSPDINVPNPMHHKVGYVTEKNAIETYEGQFPLHMVSYLNFFTAEESALSKVVDDYHNIRDSMVNKPIDAPSRAVIDDDTGLVF
jgi:hypothetical protein